MNLSFGDRPVNFPVLMQRAPVSGYPLREVGWPLLTVPGYIGTERRDAEKIFDHFGLREANQLLNSYLQSLVKKQS
jgi:hypothetical protein